MTLLKKVPKKLFKKLLMAPSKLHPPPFAGGYLKPPDLKGEGRPAKKEEKKVPCICGKCICR